MSKITVTELAGHTSGADANKVKLSSTQTLQIDGTLNMPANTVGTDELNVSGTGSSGQYLQSDGDGSMTWASLTSATPANVSDAANTSTGYFAVPSGTRAQRTGSTGGLIRYNSDTRVLEQYVSWAGTGTNGWMTMGYGQPVAHVNINTNWTNLDIDFTNGTGTQIDYHAYWIVGQIFEGDSETTQHFRLRFKDLAGNTLTSGNYRGTTSFTNTNDGFDGASGNLSGSSYIPITVDSGYGGDSSYRMTRNGENNLCFHALMTAALGHSSNISRRRVQGTATYDTSYGLQHSSFFGDYYGGNTSTHTSGQTYYPIGGVEISSSDGIQTSTGNGTNTRITVWGLSGHETDKN